MSNQNGSFRTKKSNFAQVSNIALKDNNLSLKAKGLYSLIQCYVTIENFILYKNFLEKQCNEGKTAFDSAWKELKEKGYLIQEKHCDKTGQFFYLYDLLDKPLQVKPHTDFPYLDNPCSGKQGVYNNTDYNNTDYNNIKKKLHHLDKQDDEYIFSYLKIMEDYGLKHKRVSGDNLQFIIESIETIRNDDIDIEQWEEAVTEHFENLPANNDGDIISFLKASMRYFGVHLECT